MLDYRLAFLCVLVAFAGQAPPASPPQPVPPLQRPLDPAGDRASPRRRIDGGRLPARHVPPLARHDWPGGRGRYLVVVNSGYGVQYAPHERRTAVAAGHRSQCPAGAGRRAVGLLPVAAKHQRGRGVRHQADAGAWPLYVSGGFENRIWRLTFTPGAPTPIAPAHALDDGAVQGRLDRSGRMAPDRPIPPTTTGASPCIRPAWPSARDGRELYVANNLGDSLGVVRDPDARARARVLDLRPAARREQFVYPYDVRVVRGARRRDKVYVSCWNDAAVVVVDPRRRRASARIAVGSHPNAMLATADGRACSLRAPTPTPCRSSTRPPIAKSRASGRSRRRHRARAQPAGAGALSANERVLFVANAQTQSVAVVVAR